MGVLLKAEERSVKQEDYGGMLLQLWGITVYVTALLGKRSGENPSLA
jgi:hypothetical protein